MAANLTTETLEAILPGLARGLAPGGTLVLSGILDHQGEEVAGRARGLGVTPVRVERRGGWCCV
jgi:ribosomal protein L11 methyltransferase